MAQQPCPELTLVRLLEERLDQLQPDARSLNSELSYSFQLRPDESDPEGEPGALHLTYSAARLTTQNEEDMLTWAHAPEPMPLALRSAGGGHIGLLHAHALILLRAVLRHRQRCRKLRAVQLAARLV